MKYWKDEEEPIRAFIKMFEEVMKDPDLKKMVNGVNQLIWYDYTESGPGCSFYVDCRDGKLIASSGKPAENPDLIMKLTADDAHLAWSNKLNPVMAITKGKIKVRGAAAGLLKLAPALKRVAIIYNNVLKDMGWEDKIVR